MRYSDFRTRHQAVVALAVLLLASSTARAKPALPAAQLGELEQYNVLAFSDAGDTSTGGLDRQKAIGLYDATPDEVHRVIADYAKWSEFMPKLRTSNVAAECAAGASDCNVELVADLAWPVGRSWVNLHFHDDSLAGETYRIDFSMTKGSMRRYAGRIYIEPYVMPDGTRKSTVTYELVAEPDMLAPKSAVNKVAKRSASGFVHALRQRINDLHTAGLLHPNRTPVNVASPTPTSRQRARANR